MGHDGFRRLYSDTVGEWGVRFLLRKAIPRAEADPSRPAGGEIGSPSSAPARKIALPVADPFRTAPRRRSSFETAWKAGRKKPEVGAREPGSDVTDHARDLRRDASEDEVVAFALRSARPHPFSVSGISTNIWIASKTPCATMQGSTLP